MVSLLQQAQELLAPKLPLTGSHAILAARAEMIAAVEITTTIDPRASPELAQLREKAHATLNIRILEGVLERTSTSDGSGSHYDDVRLAAACIWLSDHLALTVMGIASCQINAEGVLLISPSSEQASIHLRRVWFGSAFEELSLAAASVTIQLFAHEMARPERDQRVLEQLHAQALCIFPQHWRLPVDEGPVHQLLTDYLSPILRILANVIIGQQKFPMFKLQLSHAKALKVVPAFELVLEMQRNLPLVDRLFDVVDDGLVLGPRALAPGILAIAECVAAQVLGPDWHGKVSKFQKSYVIERLSVAPHLKILDEELLQHQTVNNVPLDVNLFVRDSLHNKIYAVQLKHFETCDKGGILQWVTRLREPDKSLGKAVQQLEHLPSLIRDDPKIRERLNQIGIATSEFESIVPVVLHNIGTMDFWELQSGVLLHDISTFCNVLKGRESTSIGSVGGEIIIRSREWTSGQPSLHQSDSVIDSYLADPEFSPQLKAFDLANRITRTLTFQGARIVAHGLGV